MENEIELKLMLLTKNIPILATWFNQLPQIKPSEQIRLGNTYYDTPNQFFAQQKMGLRVRHQNQHYELTLKTKGNIVGGLHIRPEYNLPLKDPIADFKRLNTEFNLQFDNAEEIHHSLTPTFSTDFTRTAWLVSYQGAEIEIALDQGLIKNAFGEEAICEVEFELKKGPLSAIFALLDEMPKADGMWLSALSKAQRGYLVGNPAKQAVEFRQFFAKIIEGLSPSERYQLEQNIADFIRMGNDEGLVALYTQLQPESPSENLEQYLISQSYLEKNLALMKQYFSA